MGTQEKRASNARKLGALQSLVLTTIGASGLIAVSVVAPNALKLLSYIPANASKFGNKTRGVATTLAERGLVTFVEKNGSTYLRITEKGRKQLDRDSEQSAIAAKTPKRWDKRWRIIIFDIPESMRNKRTMLRRSMLTAGFIKLQNSVWIYPYDCEDLITLLKADLHMGKQVLYMIVEHLENDKEVRAHFNLK